MTGSQKPNPNWESWVSFAIGGLETGQAELHRAIEDVRQQALRDLWLVRRELLGATARLEKKHNRKRVPDWLRHIPWVKFTALLIVVILILTGHLTVAEMKPWLLRKITEF